MYQKYCEERSISSLLNDYSLCLTFCGKPSKCTCACEKCLHANTLAGWDNSCCDQQLDLFQSKENNLHTRSAPLLSCDKPLLTCSFIHSSNHELHIQQYRETHKHYGNKQNCTIAVANTQLPMSTWSCSMPTTIKPRLLIMAGNTKTPNSGAGTTTRSFPNKEKSNRTAALLVKNRWNAEPLLSVEYTRPSLLKPPKPDYKTKIHLSKRASLTKHKKHKDTTAGGQPQRNELTITAKPCYIDYNHRPYSEDAKPCVNINKQKLAKSRLAALLELRKYANSHQHQDNSENASQIRYQTHYIHEKSQPISSSSAITIMEPWIMFN